MDRSLTYEQKMKRVEEIMLDVIRIKALQFFLLLLLLFIYLFMLNEYS